MANDSDLGLHLHEAGLDNTTLWLSNFKELGIQSLASLKLIEGDLVCFNKLEKKANFYVERKALIKLLKIDESKFLIRHDYPSFTGDSNEILEFVQSWNMEKYVTADQVQRRLECLVLIKENITTQSTNSCWVTEYLLQPSMQTFLMTILQCGMEISAIKFAAQKLLDHNDVSCIDLNSNPQIEEIFIRLYQSCSTETVDCKTSLVNFSSFNKFLLKTLRNESMAKEPKTANTLGRYLSEGIYYLRFHYKKTYEDIFIIGIVYPFLKDFINDVITLNPLSVNDVKFLQKWWTEQESNLQMYKEKNFLLLQTYLLLLVLCSFSESAEQHEILFLKQIFEMMQDLSPPLEKEIIVLLKEFFCGSSLQILIRGLQKLLVPPCQGRLYTDKKFQKLQSDCSNLSESKLETIDIKFHNLAYYEDEFSKFHSNSDAHALFETLGLCRYYPKKLGLRDAICIREEALQLSIKERKLTDPQQLPSLVLHKLMSYDTLCRSDLVPSIPHISDILPDGSDSEDNLDSGDESKLMQSHSKIFTVELNPVDLILSILLCSDDFLCQDLLSRLSKCQIAIPLIIPNPFTNKLYCPLWAMCSIVQEWKSISGSSKIEQHSCCIVKHPMPLISFIRVGKYHRFSPSKSKILNEVISDANNDFFFHRDCRGAQYNSILGKGLIDMCCYLPSAKPNDIFPEALIFLNLHGDAKQYPEQCHFLGKVSYLCIIVITEEDPQLDSQVMTSLRNLNSLQGGVIILNGVEKYPKVFETLFSKPYIVNFGSESSIKGAAEIKDAIRMRINRKLRSIKECKCIEALLNTECKGHLDTDIQSEAYQIGFSHAKKIIDIISRTLSNDSQVSIKNKMLPLQGETFWKAWASNDRELYRQEHKGKESINKYTAKIEVNKTKIRKYQLQFIEKLNPIMKLFVESLLELEKTNSNNQINYFLQVLKLELNSFSRENSSVKQYEYQEMRKELSRLQTETHSLNPEKKAKISDLSKKFEILQQDIIDSSLGLEHFFRELGQIYEAALEGKANEHADDFLNYYAAGLPKVAAKLLTEGYPLELMDGDAMHVPLKWVVAVLREAVNLLGDPKVFVLSVLGLQSTGKSTMLNATFGLQFNVSAGRCTRGAFMQLLPLDEELKTKTKCSYVIIVDTEGLRAPELDPLKTQKHDNELATFVIGLANMTLINIYGEVPGDIDDILQTSVHAFLRMSQVRYYPSCQFVHQNAGVNIKGEVARAKFTQKLNNFTVNAAQEERCHGFDTFNDVIKFDDQVDVHYFPGLWKGDPPMAPVNPGYSQTAQTLKHQFVQTLCNRANLETHSLQEQKFGFINLSCFPIKISDLWVTLLKEKFVFSFKNTLEIMAYNSLETAYSKWEWTIQSAMLTWEQKAENEINTESFETLATKVELKLKELNIYVSKTLSEPIMKEMDLFFTGKQSEVLVQWKSQFEIRLELLLKDVKTHAELHCKNLLQRKQVISDFEKDRQVNVDFIKMKVQEHIDRVKKDQENMYQCLQSRKLSTLQLQKLLARFNSQNLSRYQEDQIITPLQHIQISAMLSSNNGKLSESILNTVVEDEILTADQMKKILIKTQQTEDELQAMFDEIWMELMKQLPRVQATRNISVEQEIEQILNEHVAGSVLHGRLTTKLQKKSLRDWGGREITIKSKHYTCNRGYLEVAKQLTLYLFNTEDQDKILAIQINSAVATVAFQHLKDTCKKDVDFSAVFVKKLLRLLDDTITEFGHPSSSRISFTQKYQLDIYLFICGRAVTLFEEMASKFEEKNNPQVYLERHQKVPLFTKFKNQYKLTESEEAIADTFSAYLDEPIKTQIQKSLGAQLVDKMKASRYHQFGNKMALKAKILIDLHDENVFSNYMLYVQDIKACLQKWIKEYTIHYCNEKPCNSNKTQLQITAHEEVVRLVNVVEGIVSDTCESDVRTLLHNICNNTMLRRELGVDLRADDLLAGYCSLKDLSAEKIKEKIKKGLCQLRERSLVTFMDIKIESAIEDWKDKPYDLLKPLIGCTAQCPFCGEQCDLLEHDDTCDHRTELHRISCLAGWRDKATQEMTTTICPILVSGEGNFHPTDDSNKTHPYKDYKEIYPKWFIPPDKAAKSCTYWKWFVGTFKTDLEKHFKAIGSEIPEEWAEITWQTVKEDILSAYNINF